MLAFVFYCHACSMNSIPVWAINIFLVTVNFVCGTWLGLAWTGMSVFKVLLRVIYIAVLGTLGMKVSSHEAISSDEAVHTAILAIQTSGFIFYYSLYGASFFRDALYSQKLNQKFLQLTVRCLEIWELVRDRTDKSKASHLDWILSTLIRGSLNKGFIAFFKDLIFLLTVLVGLFIGYWHFCKWLWLAIN